MKRILLSVLGLMLLGGCSSTGVDRVRTKEELKYKKILLMPFTRSADANAALAQEKFATELSLFPDIEIIGKGQMDETTIKNLGVNHPDSFGVMDFSASAEGDERRKKVLESFKADAIVFGYCYIEEGMVSVNIQMIDAETGEMFLGFSKDASISEGMTDEITAGLAQKAAQKTIDILKENVVIFHYHSR